MSFYSQARAKRKLPRRCPGCGALLVVPDCLGCEMQRAEAQRRLEKRNEKQSDQTKKPGQCEQPVQAGIDRE